MANRWIGCVTGVLALAVATGACTSDPPNPTRPRRPRPTTTTIAPTTAAPKLGSVKIAVVLPAGGTRLSDALGIRHSVELALRHAEEDGLLTEWNVTVEDVEESTRSDDTSRAAQRIRNDDAVIGVIGPLGSEQTRRFLDALGANPLTVLGPAATDPALTGVSAASPTAIPQRRYPDFVRLAPSLTVVAARAVAYANTEQHAKSIVVVHDDTPESRSLADELTAAATTAGVIVAPPILMAAGAEDLGDPARLVTASQADLVLAANHPVDALALSNALRSGTTAPRVVSIGRIDAAPCDVVAVRPEGDVCIEAAATADSEQLRAFSEDYRAAGFTEPAGPYGPAAYDATQLLLDAIMVVDPAKKPAEARQRVLDRIRHADRTGASGPIAFDARGERAGT